MLRSYQETVTNPGQSELVFRCDNDDLESVKYIAQHNWPILVGPRRDGYKSLPGFFNELTSIATGDLFVCGNDDMLFRTKGWPSLIIEEANKYPDGIFNIGVSTGLNDDKFPFSIVSRHFVQKLGKINDERLLFSDIFLLDVMKHFGRAVKLPTVTFFHDWAGHGDDLTRREANHHEFQQVFANDRGDWTSEYRERHQNVVQEAIAKLDAGGDFIVNKVIASAESYSPPNFRSSEVWPPAATLKSWGKRPSSTSIHYGRDEFAALVRTIVTAGIARNQVVLSSYQNGMPSILWGELFEKVTTVKEQTVAPNGIVSFDKYTIASGAVWDTKFMYRLMDQIGPYTTVVLDEVRYATLISPYYLFKRGLSKPGMVVFVNTNMNGNGAAAGSRPLRTMVSTLTNLRMNSDGAGGIHRLLADLRSGYLDGIVHDIRDITPVDGVGLSYELVT